MISGSLFDLFDKCYNIGLDIFEMPGRSYFYSEKTEKKDDKIKKTINDNGNIRKFETDSPVNNRIDSRLCSHGNFPPTDLYIDKDDGTYHVECALAGIDADRIGISYADEYLTVEVQPAEKSKVAKYPNRVYGTNSIKSDAGCKKSIWINPKLFDANKIKYEFFDGILRIVVGKNESYIAAKQIKTLGKPEGLSLEKKEEMPEETSSDDK